ncbi:MAG: hypothetical protein IKM85_06590 [Bacteroidales bacterium]|nr:hypothetical protein [Bacteroidales bacterium]
MATERKYTRAEMLTKPVSRISMFANRSPWNYEEGSVYLANRSTARGIFDSYHRGTLTIENGYFKPKTNKTMPNKRKRTAPAKATAATRKAVKIYDEQKETYQKMLKTKVRQGKKVTTAAKEASSVYKQMYGATPTARWKRALREARRS